MPSATPTVGRIVHYKTRGSADGVYPPTNFASIITEVQTALGTVSLAVFGPQGLRFELTVQQGDAAGQWNWPERPEMLGGNGGQLTPRPNFPTGPSGNLAYMPAIGNSNGASSVV